MAYVRITALWVCTPPLQDGFQWCWRIPPSLIWIPDPVRREWPPSDGPTIAVGAGDDPHPVPWIRDLGLLSAAVAAVSQLGDTGLAQSLNQQLLEAAQGIAKESGATVHLREQEVPDLG